ncbi:hypothetical protein GS539_21370 [Rhodococcus hoagii]|nr:hypothetical protein [Prescottella equi]
MPGYTPQYAQAPSKPVYNYNYGNDANYSGGGQGYYSGYSNNYADTASRSTARLRR